MRHVYSEIDPRGSKFSSRNLLNSSTILVKSSSIHTIDEFLIIKLYNQV